MRGTSRTGRSVAVVTCLAAAALIAPAASAAEIDPELRGGYWFDSEGGFIGGGLVIDVGETGRWYANPNLEVVFPDEGDLFALSADFHRDLPLEGDWHWWLGAGPTLLWIEPDNGDDEIEPGINGLAGIGLLRGKVRPFAQGKVVVSDESDFSIAIGVRFD